MRGGVRGMGAGGSGGGGQQSTPTLIWSGLDTLVPLHWYSSTAPPPGPLLCPETVRYELQGSEASSTNVRIARRIEYEARSTASWLTICSTSTAPPGMLSTCACPVVALSSWEAARTEDSADCTPGTSVPASVPRGQYRVMRSRYTGGGGAGGVGGGEGGGSRGAKGAGGEGRLGFSGGGLGPRGGKGGALTGGGAAGVDGTAGGKYGSVGGLGRKVGCAGGISATVSL